jgi:hypothetical protein|tara:strand:+ start:12049 stop:12309 length:261 start_codon:yes stop_codon:yes gene_type:complete
MTQAKEDLNIKLAVYMERLDNYIETHSILTENICSKLDSMDNDIDEIKTWRSKFLGAKWITGAIGILALHTTVVLSAIFGMVRIIK